MKAMVYRRNDVSAIVCRRDFVGAVSYPRDFPTACQWEFVRRKSCQRDFVLVLGGLLLAAMLAHGAPPAGAAADGQTVDSVAPRVTLSSAAPDLTRTNPIPMTATFSEDVAGFTDTDIAVYDETAGTWYVLSVEGRALVWGAN